MQFHDLALDFETFYDTRARYSLRAMDTIAYVRDPRFHVFGASVVEKNPSGVARKAWITAADLPAWFAARNWRTTRLIGHNLNFDGLILVERYGVRAGRYFDTLGATRALFPELLKYGLDAVGLALFGEGKLDARALRDINGTRHLTAEQEARLSRYAMRDADLTWRLHELTRQVLPASEQDLLHLTTRMAVEASLVIDAPLAQEALTEATIAHKALLAASPVPKTTLASNPKFAAWMTSQGIAPPTKLNKKGETAFAFAKTDRDFQLTIADHPEHHAVWQARLGVKSTLDISRAQRFVNIAASGQLPVPLAYYAAHTGRWGGTDGLNLQNLRRGGKLRLSIRAPKGYSILVADSSQVELRTNAWFCDVEWLLELLRRGDCPYCEAATRQFGRVITRADKAERQLGKALELGLGFQMGAPTLRRQLAIGMLGLDPVYLTDSEATNAVDVWRSQHADIRNMWYWLKDMIERMAHDSEAMYEHKGLTFLHDNILMPNGMALHYDDLRLDPVEGNYIYGREQKTRRIYGGKMLENIVQALARTVMAEQMLKIDQLPDTRVVMTIHDEVIALAPTEVAEQRHNAMIQLMSTPPAWAPTLPLAAEGGYSDRYDK